MSVWHGLQGVSGASHTRLKTTRNLSFRFPLTLPCSFRVWSWNNYHHLDNTWAINHPSCCLSNVERKSVPRLIVRLSLWNAFDIFYFVCESERERERERGRERVSKRVSKWEPFLKIKRFLLYSECTPWLQLVPSMNIHHSYCCRQYSCDSYSVLKFLKTLYKF